MCEQNHVNGSDRKFLLFVDTSKRHKGMYALIIIICKDV